MIIIYHNNKCSKSRQCLKLLKENNVKYKVIEYLKDELSTDEIKEIVYGLDGDIKDIIRINEKEIKGLKVNFDDKDEIVKIISKYKICMQRPIIYTYKKYIICRPPEKVLHFIKK